MNLRYFTSYSKTLLFIALCACIGALQAEAAPIYFLVPFQDLVAPGYPDGTECHATATISSMGPGSPNDPNGADNLLLQVHVSSVGSSDFDSAPKLGLSWRLGSWSGSDGQIDTLYASRSPYSIGLSGSKLGNPYNGPSGTLYLYNIDSAAVAAMQKADKTRLDQNVNGDPVQLATGSESRSSILFNFTGARNWSFALGYNSGLAVAQAPSNLGRGWTHNYQAWIETTTAGLTVHWDSQHANAFTATSGNPNLYSCAEDGGQYDSLAVQSGGGWLLTHRDQSSLLFNSTGQLIEDRDTRGRRLVFSYTATKLTQITEPVSGTSLTLAYNSNGFLTTLTDGMSAVVQLSYQLINAEYALSQVTDANGKKTTYTYDNNMLLASVADDLGYLVVSNINDTAARVTGQLAGISGAQTSSYSYTTVNGAPTTTYRDHNGKQSTYTFDSQFNLIGESDPLGHTQSYTYDAANRLIAKTDELGRTTTFTYDSAGNLLTATDPASQTTTFVYDASNNLLQVTDPAKQVTKRTYDTSNNLLTVTDALNRQTVWTYDTNSLPLTMTLPGGGVFNYTYTNGRLTSATDPNGVVTSYGYDADGRLLYRQDGNGKRVSYTYDAAGNVLTVTNAIGQATVYGYDQRNRLTSMQDPVGAVTHYAYDNDSNLVTATDALGNVTTYTYDGEDRLKTAKDALNRVTTYNYDDAGRLTSLVDPAGQTTAYQYDAAGQVTALVDALGKTTTAGYESRGLLTSVTDPLNRTTSFSYNSVRLRVTATDPLMRLTKFQYDALNRLLKVTDPGSLVSKQGFDGDGNRTSLTNPASNATLFARDLGGRLTSVTTPEGRVTGYHYNSLGLLDTATLPSTHATNFAYDDAQRLTSTTDAVGTISLTRDAVGRILTVVEGTKTITRVYDLMGRLTSYTDGDGNTIGYQYDNIGRLITLTYPGGKQVAYAYDTAGRLQTVTDWASRVTTYSYDSDGRLTQTMRPNGTKQTRTYDFAGQLTQLTELAPNGSTVIYSGSHNYDVAGQLVGETLTPAPQPMAVSAVQTFDRDNRLLTHNGAAITFDSDGNLLSIASGVAPASYSYDARNRLTAAGGVSYGYNAENRRISITDGTGTTSFVVNPNAVLDQVLIRTAPDGTKTYYIYGLGLLHEESGTSVRYYHQDRRGDTVALTDSAGAVTDRAAYGIYGELLSRTGTTNTPFLFNGRWGVQTDSSGIYYHRARYYHPILRRFINQDNILGSITTNAGLNRYAYANGQPISGIDPFGLANIKLFTEPVTVQTAKGPRTFSAEELNLATRVIYAEAKNTPDDQYEVATVMWNRLEATGVKGGVAKTFRGVVTAPNQFQGVTGSPRNTTKYRRACETRQGKWKPEDADEYNSAHDQLVVLLGDDSGSGAHSTSNSFVGPQVAPSGWIQVSPPDGNYYYTDPGIKGPL